MAMTEEDVRAAASRVGSALVAGDIDAVIGVLSDELKRNLGEVVALFPLPANEATVESIQRGGSSYLVVLAISGETDETKIQTRWKERDDGPRIVEVGHLSTTARAGEGAAPEGELGEPGDEGPEPGG